jgi:hypothetical protein
MKPKYYYSLPFLFFIIFSAFTFNSSAQTQKQTFKKEDRVWVSPLSLKDEKYWRAATVTEVHNYGGKYSYSVICDPQTKGGSPESFLVNGDWVKPLKAENKIANANIDVQPQTNHQNNTQTNTTQQQSTTVACFASDPDSKGKTALEQSFRGAVRTDFEREPQPGEDGRVTLSFQNFTIGQPHPYRVYEDPNDAQGKTIYPVRATFTTCTDYNRRIVLVKRERAFSCYKNTAGEWACEVVAAANTNVKDESKSIDKPQQ